MISLVNGVVRSISLDKVIVEVGGVGLSLAVTQKTSAQLNIGVQAQLFTTLVVREDALTLYGFLEDGDRALFELVQTVSGIGPKVAQSILAASEASVIANAIVSSNLKSLESVPGLGKKGAQRLVLELKDKVVNFAGGNVSAKLSITNQVENALQGLGYSAKESSAMISQIAGSEKIENLSAAEILKLALKTGGKK